MRPMSRGIEVSAATFVVGAATPLTSVMRAKSPTIGLSTELVAYEGPQLRYPTRQACC